MVVPFLSGEELRVVKACLSEQREPHHRRVGDTHTPLSQVIV